MYSATTVRHATQCATAFDKAEETDNDPLPSFSRALEIRVAWALYQCASFGGRWDAYDLYIQAVSGAYEMGFDSYPNIPMSEFLKDETHLALSWQAGFADASLGRWRPENCR